MSLEYVPRERYLAAMMSARQSSLTELKAELAYLKAVLELPKGTEHFISDLHGEYDAFCHILNNCSGVIREKVTALFDKELDERQMDELLTLIYYPKERLNALRKEGRLDQALLEHYLNALVLLAREVASKYTQRYVEEAFPPEQAKILKELIICARWDNANRLDYYHSLVVAMVNAAMAPALILALCQVIKHLAVERLHVLGDIFDRGPRPDGIMDLLIGHHWVDLTWGNHDVLWIGAAAGNSACVAAVIRNQLRYDNTQVLESGYGISLRELYRLAAMRQPRLAPEKAALSLITALMFKLEGQLIERHPDWGMADRLQLHRVDWSRRMITLEGKDWPIKPDIIMHINPEKPYHLDADESSLMDTLTQFFLESEKLQRHAAFLLSNGGMYKVCNGNLLYHGCIPCENDGRFALSPTPDGRLAGKALMDACDKAVRRALKAKAGNDVDFLWYLWCGELSPLCGRKVQTFHNDMTVHEKSLHEPRNPYYTYPDQEELFIRILSAFAIDDPDGRVVNGHTPVLTVKGEGPVRANGRMLLIDGGFCTAYQKKTGIAGYTLIGNSHGLRIVSHEPFPGKEHVLADCEDMLSTDSIQLPYEKRRRLADTDRGQRIQQRVEDLQALITAWEEGFITDKKV